MKIGDKVRSTKVRPGEVATIVKSDIKVRNGVKPNRKREIQSTYTAEFDDGSSLIFYGFNINKTIFKVEAKDGQITLDQLFDMKTE